MRLTNIHYLAGLLDGEGCFGLVRTTVRGLSYSRIGINIGMTDREPVEKAAALFRSNVHTYPTKHNNKPVHVTQVSGAKAASWMMTLYPLLCPRRQMKIRACLTAWRETPGRGGPRRLYRKMLEVAQ